MGMCRYKLFTKHGIQLLSTVRRGPKELRLKKASGRRDSETQYHLFHQILTSS